MANKRKNKKRPVPTKGTGRSGEHRYQRMTDEVPRDPGRAQLVETPRQRAEKPARGKVELSTDIDPAAFGLPRDSRWTPVVEVGGDVPEGHKMVKGLRIPQSALPANVREMNQGGSLPVAISTDDTIPPGAGELLGTTTREARLSDGQVIEAGAKIYRIVDQEQLDLLQQMQAIDPELTKKLTEGMTPEMLAESKPEIAAFLNALRKKGMDLPSTLTFSTDDEGRPFIRAGAHEDIKHGTIFAESETGQKPEGLPNWEHMGRITAEEQAMVRDHELLGQQHVPPAFRRRRMTDEQLAKMSNQRLSDYPGDLQNYLDTVKSQERETDARYLPDETGKPRLTIGSKANLDRLEEAQARERIRRFENIVRVPLLPRENRSLKAVELLNIHAALARQFRDPGEPLVRYFNGFMETVLQKAMREGGQAEAAVAWQWLFYPARNGTELIQVIAKQLADARTYQVTSDMVDLVTDVYEKRRKGYDPDKFEGHHVPYEAGFCWFDKPLALKDLHGKTMLHRAISWSTGSLTDSDDRLVPVLRLTSWSHTQDVDDYWDKEAMDDISSIVGDFTMGHTVIIPFGQRFLDQKERTADETVWDDVARWVHTLFRFLDAEIVIDRPAPVPKAVRRHARKSLKHGEVTVITLRKTKNISEVKGHGTREYTCRWTVEGHYRHLGAYEGDRHHALPLPWDREHCVSCGVRITFIHPYVKGPSHLSFKTTKKLYKLTR
jgi:hypothetical protein